MCHILLVGWDNVENFSTMTADLGVSYPVLPELWGEHECFYLLYVPTTLALFYYGGLDDIRRVGSYLGSFRV